MIELMAMLELLKEVYATQGPCVRGVGEEVAVPNSHPRPAPMAEGER